MEVIFGWTCWPRWAIYLMILLGILLDNLWTYLERRR